MSLYFWSSLPEEIRARLLQGGAGRVHMHQLAQEIFAALGKAEPGTDVQSLFLLGCDVLLAVWEESPCDTTLAASLLDLHGRHPFLPEAALGILKFYSRLPAPSVDLDQLFNLRRFGDLNAWHSLIQQEQRKNSAPVSIVDGAVNVCLRNGQLSWLHRIVEADAHVPRPIKQALQSDVLFAQERWDEAAQGYAAARNALPLITWQVRQAECLYRAGRCEEAVALWTDAHKKRPWNINILLRLSDVVAGRDNPAVAVPPGRGAILLYTWNKGEDMDATLASVAASELGENRGKDSAVRIYVLDNGSTDSTPEVFRKWEAHFGERLSVTTLPVNVGAPAARNWLLTLPEVRAAHWAAFLDDDVRIPPDWLAHLWAGIENYPESGVSSGHAVDFHAPMTQQWTDMHIIPLPQPEGAAKDVFSDHFRFSALHEQAFDFGHFNFMRPCVTAIGCCHMFTRKAMDEGGLFDVRFSPSQSDDVDHDMRRGLQGNLPVYNGHLRVLHKRSTGYLRSPDRRNWASASGNWYKLQVSYSREEVQKIYELDQQTMLTDVLRRVALLKKAGC